MEKRIQGSDIADKIIVEKQDVSFSAFRCGQLVERTAHDNGDISGLKNILFRTGFDRIIVFGGCYDLRCRMPMKGIVLGKVIVKEPDALDIRVLYCFSAVFKNREHK